MLYVKLDDYEVNNGTVIFHATPNNTLNVLRPNYIYPYRIEYNIKKLIWDIYITKQNKYVYDLPEEIIFEMFNRSDFFKMIDVIDKITFLSMKYKK